ncbi:hypothetical protein K4L06_05745 [Lysobacter sp. BMK333-48F3]|uniref:hypothetical protein n=1 Tax=Lysobacter sp. BMK333-48F3 TaxID=2867962 RepID=UPI001C8C82C9|nr:hypothetical protein [Lysobacter sp. BMK333-48F3]MBX9400808.1 hypothetical protein [Lysobacter sp. BMK333-48F3]
MRAEALQALRGDGGRAGFFIGLFCDDDCGLELEPDLLAAAARLGIGLDLALYPGHPPEDRAAAAD